MKSLHFGLVALIALAGSTLLAPHVTAQDLPSPEQVIQQHIKSLGGKEKLSSIQSMVTQAVINMPSPQGEMEVDFELLQQGNKFLFVMEIPGLGEMRQGSDGEHFWMSNPMMGAQLLQGAHHRNKSSSNISRAWEAKKSYHRSNRWSPKLSSTCLPPKAKWRSISNCSSKETNFCSSWKFLVWEKCDREATANISGCPIR